jgi:hypothetical protein
VNLTDTRILITHDGSNASLVIARPSTRSRSFARRIHKWFPAYRIPPQSGRIREPYLLDHYRAVGGTDPAFPVLERTDSQAAPADLAVRSEANRQ